MLLGLTASVHCPAVSASTCDSRLLFVDFFLRLGGKTAWFEIHAQSHMTWFKTSQLASLTKWYWHSAFLRGIGGRALAMHVVEMGFFFGPDFVVFGSRGSWRTVGSGLKDAQHGISTAIGKTGIATFPNTPLGTLARLYSGTAQQDFRFLWFHVCHRPSLTINPKVWGWHAWRLIAWQGAFAVVISNIFSSGGLHI